VGRWRHRTVNGWNMQIHRERLGISADEIATRSADAIEQARQEVVVVLRRRLDECRRSLETLTLYGAETAEEQEDKEHLLYEHWALSRALEGRG
jgi:hypothetical protein